MYTNSIGMNVGFFLIFLSDIIMNVSIKVVWYLSVNISWT